MHSTNKWIHQIHVNMICYVIYLLSSQHIFQARWNETDVSVDMSSICNDVFLWISLDSFISKEFYISLLNVPISRAFLSGLHIRLLKPFADDYFINLPLNKTC